MALYRCLFFIGADDKITNLEEADHADDARANDWGVALLQRHPHYKACEVWLRQRLISRHDQP
jgi:hypothetical protein